jgi:Domain of unknown function (DUF1611_C) P-loop domain
MISRNARKKLRLPSGFHFSSKRKVKTMLSNSSTSRLHLSAKWAFSTRRVGRSDIRGYLPDVASAEAGDLILGRVVSIGQHPRIQLVSGRPSKLYPGDLVVLPCGARYAPDQFEGVAEIDPNGCDMLAGGGCLGRMVSRNDTIKTPTRVQPIGRLTGVSGQVINLSAFSFPKATARPSIPVIAVIGTSMNSGKTTATAALAHGLKTAGWQVAALKGTGTGSFGDFNEYVDAGAHFVADFTDAGMVSTYLQPVSRVKAGIVDLLAAAEASGAEVAVLEIADGIFQLETDALLRDNEFRSFVSSYVFACGDAVAAAGGVAALAKLGIEPLALTGLLSCSPMASAEAKTATGISVMTQAQLHDPIEANRLAALAGARLQLAGAA